MTGTTYQFIKIAKNAGVVKGPHTARLVEFAASVPGRRKWKGAGELYVELTAANIEYTIKLLDEDLTCDEEIKKLYQEILNIRQFERDALDRVPIKPELRKFPFKTKPFEHQLEAFSFGISHKNFALFMEQGTGKTKVYIDILAYLYLANEIDTAMIVAPSGVHRQWALEQIPLHMSPEVKYEAAYWMTGMPLDVKRQWEKTKEADKKLRIFLIHFDVFSREGGFSLAQPLLVGQKSALNLDESSRIKHAGAARSKSLLKLSPFASRRAIMTGTPITQGAQDLYSQFSFLDKRILGFSSFYTFRNRYCVMGGWQQKQIVGYQNTEELQTRLKGHSYRKLADECLDLPGIIPSTFQVELTKEQKELYNDLKKNFIIELGEEIISAPLAITRLVKFQQILSGFVSDGEKITRIPSNRPKNVTDILEDLQGKTIVWARFHEDIKMISEVLEEAKIGFVTFYGGNKREVSDENLDEFKRNPEKTVLLSIAQYGGTGHDIPQAQNTIWYLPTFNLEEYLQAIKRNYRYGQTKKVRNIYMEAPKTTDTKTYKALIRKQNFASSMLDKKRILDLFNEDDSSLASEFLMTSHGPSNPAEMP